MKYVLVLALMGFLCAHVHSYDSRYEAFKQARRGYKDYNRNVKMLVENKLQWTLQHPKAFAYYGQIASLPKDIEPCEDGMVTGHKTSMSMAGTTGLANWRIEEKGLTVVVFWDVPYNSLCIGCCNRLSLGIYKGLSGNALSSDTIDDYYAELSEKPEDIPTNGRDVTKTLNNSILCKHAEKICTINAGIKVCGVMSTNSEAVIGVTVEPANTPTMCSDDENPDYM